MHVSLSNDLTASNEDTVTIQVTARPPTASIVGGDRTNYISQVLFLIICLTIKPLVLNATLSSSLDTPFSNLRFTWSCSNSNSNSCGVSSNSPLWNIPASSLSIGVYVFTVKVTDSIFNLDNSGSVK